MSFIKALLIIFSLLAVGATSMGQAAPPPAAKKQTAAATYICKHCNLSNTRSGNCIVCGGKTTKINGTAKHECPKCKAHGSIPANCPRCKVAMVPEVVTYQCDAMHTSAKKVTKCGSCGKKTKEKHVKMMPMPLKKGGRS